MTGGPCGVWAAGVREIRILDEGNNYRCMYVTNIGDAVCVLHVFVKKSQKTSTKDIDRAKARLKALGEHS